MKLTLKQKRSIILGIGIVGLVFVFLDAISRGGSGLGAIGLICVAVAFIISLFWLRCPHCKEWLGKNAGDYCQFCGEKLDWK